MEFIFFDEVTPLTEEQWERIISWHRKRSGRYIEKLGAWEAPLSPRKQLLEDAAKEYHDLCDAYDRSACTAISPRTQEPIPANSSELSAINKNALKVRRDILAHYGITEKDRGILICCARILRANCLLYIYQVRRSM